MLNISEPQTPKKEQIMMHRQGLYTGAPWEEAIDKNMGTTAWRRPGDDHPGYFVETMCSKTLRTTVTEMGWLSGEHAPAAPPRTEDPARTHKEGS